MQTPTQPGSGLSTIEWTPVRCCILKVRRGATGAAGCRAALDFTEACLIYAAIFVEEPKQLVLHAQLQHPQYSQPHFKTSLTNVDQAEAGTSFSPS